MTLEDLNVDLGNFHNVSIKKKSPSLAEIRHGGDFYTVIIPSVLKNSNPIAVLEVRCVVNVFHFKNEPEENANYIVQDDCKIYRILKNNRRELLTPEPIPLFLGWGVSPSPEKLNKVFVSSH